MEGVHPQHTSHFVAHLAQPSVMMKRIYNDVNSHI